jgi:hypothetical protein
MLHAALHSVYLMLCPPLTPPAGGAPKHLPCTAPRPAPPQQQQQGVWPAPQHQQAAPHVQELVLVGRTTPQTLLASPALQQVSPPCPPGRPLQLEVPQVVHQLSQQRL